MVQHFDAIVVDCENEQNAALLFKSAHNSGSNQASLAVAVVEGQAGVAKAFRLGANLVLTKPIHVEQSKGRYGLRAACCARVKPRNQPAFQARPSRRPWRNHLRPRPFHRRSQLRHRIRSALRLLSWMRNRRRSPISWMLLCSSTCRLRAFGRREIAGNCERVRSLQAISLATA